MRLTCLNLLLASAVAGILASPAALAHGDSCANPYQYAGTVALKAGYGGVVGEFAVPAGYRLQIEYVSAGFRMSTNAGRAAFAIGTSVGGAFAWHALPSNTGYALNDRQTTQSVTLYADPGSLIKIEMDRDSGSDVSATGRYAVTGCLYPAK